MNTYGTSKDGRTLDDELVERLAAHAEAGFPGATLMKPKTGRPGLTDAGASPTRTVRLPRGLDAALVARAQADQTTPSEVIREALRDFLKSA